ncbi:MAG: cation acetate symporter, partial [Lysinibacillus sp.]
LILVAVSPNVWNPVAGKAIFVGDPLIMLTNPALISVPLGFLGGWIGTMLSKESDEAKYREVNVKANTGISVQDASH